jgi:hypothetical protein
VRISGDRVRRGPVAPPGVIETNVGSNVLDHRAEPGPYEELGTLWARVMETPGGPLDQPGPSRTSFDTSSARAW